MAGHKTHIRFGYVFTLVVFGLLLGLKTLGIRQIDTGTLVLAVPVVFVYSQLPDLDHRSSKITWLFLIVADVMLITGYLFPPLAWEYLGVDIAVLVPIGILLLTLTLLGAGLNHRGFAHSLSAGAIASVPLLWVHWLLAVAGFAAFTSHLILDKEVSLI